MNTSCPSVFFFVLASERIIAAQDPLGLLADLRRQRDVEEPAPEHPAGRVWAIQSEDELAERRNLGCGL